MRLFLFLMSVAVAVGLIGWGIALVIRDRPIDAETREALTELKTSEIQDLSNEITDQVQLEAADLEPNEELTVGRAAVTELTGDVAEEAISEIFREDVPLNNEQAVEAVALRVAEDELAAALPGTEAPLITQEVAREVAREVPQQLDLVVTEVGRRLVEDVTVPEELRDQVARLASTVVTQSVEEAANSGVSLDDREEVEPIVEAVVRREVDGVQEDLAGLIDIERLEAVLQTESTLGITNLEMQVSAEALENIDFGQLEQNASSEISEIAVQEVKNLIGDASSQVVARLVEGEASPDQPTQTDDLVQAVVDQETNESFGSANVQIVTVQVEQGIANEVRGRSEQLKGAQGVDKAEEASGISWLLMLPFIGAIASAVIGTSTFGEISSRLVPVRISVGDDPRKVDPPPEVLPSGEISVQASFKVAYAGTADTILEQIVLLCQGSGYRSEATTGRGGQIKVTNLTRSRRSRTESLPLLIRPGEEIFITAHCISLAQKETGAKAGALRLKEIRLKLRDHWKTFRV